MAVSLPLAGLGNFLFAGSPILEVVKEVFWEKNKAKTQKVLTDN